MHIVVCFVITVRQPFVKWFALCYRFVIFMSVCLSVCDIGVLWRNGSMDQDETWQGDRPRLRPHRARWGPSSPSPKGHSLQFSANLFCGQMAGWIKMPLGTEVGLGPGDIVLGGDPAPPPKKGHSPQFSAHVCCGQMAGLIKMPLGKVSKSK